MGASVLGRGDVVGVAEPVPVTLAGLEAGTAVPLRVACTDGRGAVHCSEAAFVADRGGVVDPSRHPSQAGSYTGVDPFGLWWSLSQARREPFAPGDVFPTTVEAVVDGSVAGRVAFERRWLLEGMSRERVADAGLVGVCYLPVARPAPAVIVVGGSDGGLRSAEPTAAALAGSGLVGFALAYFGLPGLPRRLVDIPLEYFETALGWILCHPAVAGEPVGVLGRSRGGELALLLGATFGRIGAIVGIVPSGIIWGGFPVRAWRPRPAWTHHGRPVPFARSGLLPRASGPVPLRPSFEEGLADTASVAAATIPVERTAGPILLVSGGADQMWPSAELAEMVVNRLLEFGQEDRVEHLSYPGAGHLAGALPFLPAGPVVVRHPVVRTMFNLGGDRAANGRASSHAWGRITRFLRTNLGAKVS